MNDNQFQGDRLYEKDDRNKVLSLKVILIIIGAAIVVITFIWALSISGAFQKDKTAPTIYLNGNKEITIDQGADFTDPGVQAVDDKDGVVTSQVVASGTVDTSKIGVYHITYTIKDKAGNITVVKRTINVGQDFKGPEITITPNGNETASKTQSAKVSVVDSSGVKVMKYQWTNSTTKPLETTFTTTFENDETITSPENLNGDYYLWIYAEDVRDNVSVISSNVFKISQGAVTTEDKTAPVANFAPTSNSIYAKSHSTIVTLSDQSSIKSSLYEWTTSTTAPNKEDFSEQFNSGDSITTPSDTTGEYYLWIYAEDSEGNNSITSSGVFKINKDIVPASDTTAPIVYFSPNGNNTIAKQHSSRVTASDGSGVKTLMYQWTTSSIKPSVTSFSQNFSSGNTLYSSDNVTGTYYLWIYAEDNKGNNTIVGSRAFKIGTPVVPSSDTTAPTVSFSTNGSGFAKASGTVINVADASGVSTAKYKWTTSATAPSGGEITTSFNSGNTISTPSGVTGTYYLWIYTIDTKGNSTVVGSKAFSLDNTAPGCSTSGGSSSWYSSSRKISITCNDANSGVATCNGVAGTSTSVTYSSSTNNTYSYTVTDKAGNSNTCSAAVKIDKTAPTCSLEGDVIPYDSTKFWKNVSRTVHVTWKDSGSGVNGTETYTRKWDAANISVKSVTEKMKDNAGNEGTCTIYVFYDTTKPTCKPNYTQTYPEASTWTNQTRSFSVKCDDGGSGLEYCGTKEFNSGEGYLYTYYLDRTQSASARSVTIDVYDRAQNHGTCLLPTYVDKNEPNPPTGSQVSTYSRGFTEKVTCGTDYLSGTNASSCLLYCRSTNTSCTPTTSTYSGATFTIDVVSGGKLCTRTQDIAGNKSTIKCY